jgi:hypothetical protein
MSTHVPRLFADDDTVRRVGEGLLARTLPRPDWTHEAHLAACLWLLRDRPDIHPEHQLPDIIRSYNASVGGVNSDSEGYHETITQAYVRLIREWLSRNDRGEPLAKLVNTLLESPLGRRDVLLQHWSTERLFSSTARRDWVDPDLLPLGAGTEPTQGLS